MHTKKKLFKDLDMGEEFWWVEKNSGKEYHGFKVKCPCGVAALNLGSLEALWHVADDQEVYS